MEWINEKKVYLKRGGLCLLSSLVLPLLVTIDVFRLCIVLAAYVWVLYSISRACPKDGFVFEIGAKDFAACGVLCACLGFIFYQRWIPAGILSKIGERIGVSNSIVLILVTAVVCAVATIGSTFLLKAASSCAGEDSTQRIRTKRLAGLEIVRAFACLEVFCCHYGVAGTGALGVSLFFVMSGFLMMYNHRQMENISEEKMTVKANLAYAYGKMRKLYPLHLLMLFVALIMKCQTESNGILLKVLAQASMTHAWFPNPDYYFALNNISWYLSAGLFTYFCFPWICEMFRKHASSLFAVSILCTVAISQSILAIIIGAVLKWNEGLQYYIFYICPLLRVGDFIIGCCLGSVFLNVQSTEFSRTRDAWRSTWLECMIIVLLWISDYLVSQGWILKGFRHSIMLLPISAMTVWCFAFANGFIARKLRDNKLVLRIAALSPYIYLVHVMVRNVMRVLLSQNEGTYWYATVGLAISFGIAIIYEKVISKKSRTHMN